MKVKSGPVSQVLRKPANATKTLLNLDYGSHATIHVEAQNCAGLTVGTVEVESEGNFVLIKHKVYVIFYCAL